MPSLLTLAGGREIGVERRRERTAALHLSPGSNNTHPPHGCGDEDAPPSPRGPPTRCLRLATLRVPGTGKGLSVRQAETSRPSCAGSALTHIPRRRRSGLSLRCNRSPPPRRSATKSGPRAEGPRRRRTVERAGRGPSLSALRKAKLAPAAAACPAPLPSFLQPTPLPLWATGKPACSRRLHPLRSHTVFQRRRRHWLGRPIYVRLSLPVGLWSGVLLTAETASRGPARPARTPRTARALLHPGCVFTDARRGRRRLATQSLGFSGNKPACARRFPRWPLGVSGRGT